MSADESESAPAKRRFKIPRWLSILVALAFLAAAAFVIRNELAEHSPGEILHALRSIDSGAISSAIGLVLISYACLIGCERIALSIMGRGDIPLRRMWRPTFTAYALGNAVGFSYATVPVARARLYRNHLSGGEIAALSAITGATVMLAGAAIAGIGLLISAEHVAERLFGYALLWRFVGCILVAPVVAWLGVALSSRGSVVTLFGMRVPKLRVAFAQVLMGMADWAAAVGVLYVLMPGNGDWSYFGFLAVFLASGVIASVSGSPAGIGVFEASILALSPNAPDAPGMAAALIAYRIIWTLTPLVSACFLMIYDLARPAIYRALKKNPGS